jgi:hypothetical protein
MVVASFVWAPHLGQDGSFCSSCRILSVTHTQVTPENRLRPGSSGAWDWWVGGAPGTHQLWPTMIRRLYKIAHSSREQCGLSPLFTAGKPATRPAGTAEEHKISQTLRDRLVAIREDL